MTVIIAPTKDATHIATWDLCLWWWMIDAWAPTTMRLSLPELWLEVER
jgi:hypothetical protein